MTPRLIVFDKDEKTPRVRLVEVYSEKWVAEYESLTGSPMNGVKTPKFNKPVNALVVLKAISEYTDDVLTNTVISIALNAWRERRDQL